jgi:hypothetical protein
VSLIGNIPDVILRHEETRRVARHCGVPLELLWDRIKPAGGSRPVPVRGAVGTPGTPTPPPVLSDGGIPQAEHALLSLLVRGEELIPLILGTLKDEWLTHETVRKVAGAFREARSAAGPIDFQRQIAHLREDNDISLLARAAAEEGPEPSPTRVAQVLHALEEAYLRRQGDSLQDEIQRAEAEKRPREEVERLSREKQEVGRRIQQLKPSRKGKALVD